MIASDHINGTFEEFNAAVQQNFFNFTAGLETKVMSVSTDGLFEIYLNGFPESERQEHNCHCCRRFIEQFGGLCFVHDDGKPGSTVWPLHETSQYGNSSRLLANEVARRKVVDVFMTNQLELGIETAGGWSHFAVPVSMTMRRGLSDERLHQAVMLKRQDVETLNRALLEFNLDTLKVALNLLQSDSLYRSEKVLGPCQFLYDLQKSLLGVKGQPRMNIIWNAVSDAPAGFATPRSGMIGTLLEDIAAGKNIDAVSRAFAAKMNPLQYQRPSAAPTAGNIQQAERIFAEMGLAPSLERRFARLDEVNCVWMPTIDKGTPLTGGVFSHLSPKKEHPSEIIGNAGVITYERFARDVLPKALEIQVKTETRMSWAAMLTAVHPEAPCLFQWGNHLSWYIYHKGSASAQWGMKPNAYVNVTGIAKKPSTGHNHADGRIFIIEGAVDSEDAGLGLFPECLRSDLHPVRATIEAFSKTGLLQGRESASACGLVFGAGRFAPLNVRVKTELGQTDYLIDRWE